jgi:hypothetical protein
VVFGLGIATVLTLVFTPSMLALRVWFTTYAIWIAHGLAALSMGRSSRAARDWAQQRQAARVRQPELIWGDLLNEPNRRYADTDSGTGSASPAVAIAPQASPVPEVKIKPDPTPEPKSDTASQTGPGAAKVIETPATGVTGIDAAEPEDPASKTPLPPTTKSPLRAAE